MPNKYGVKVGDIFKASWGYDDTTTNFFQVVAVVGDQSVRVREVCLPILMEVRGYPMSNKTCRIVNDILPPLSSSLFIKDNEKGDLKRLKGCGWLKDNDPYFKISSFAIATLVRGKTVEAYDSCCR